MASTPELYTVLPSSTKEFLVPWDALDKHYEGAPHNAYHDSVDIKYVDYAGNSSTIRYFPQFYWEGRSLESDGYLDAYPYTALRDQIDLDTYTTADDDFIGIQTTYAAKGDTLVVKTTTTAYTITAKHAATGGNLRLLGFSDLVMTPDETYLVFTYDGVGTWVQVSETVGGGGTGTGLSAVIVGPTGDYATLQAALSASETFIILDEGDHAITGSVPTVPRGTTIIGQGPEQSTITSSTLVGTLVVQEGAIIKDCTIENTYASGFATVQIPYWVAYSDWMEMYNVRIIATGGTTDALYTDSETRLFDCQLLSTGGYAASVDGTADLEIFGGWLEGASTDIEMISGPDVRFYNLPKLANGNYTGTGTLHGWYQDAAGEIFGFDDPLLDMVELASDPATPATGRWKLYFKAGGAYIIDDAGSVTGPLGSGGGSGWPFTGNVLTVDTTDTDADYSTLSAAIAAASAGDVILLSAESHSCVNQTLPAGVHLVGQGMGATILTCTGNIFALKVGNGSICMNFTVQQNSTHSPAYGIYMGTSGNTSQFINVEVDCNGNTYDMHGFYIQGSTVLTDCKADCSPSTANGYCVVAMNTGVKRIVGGEYVAGGSGCAFSNDTTSTAISLVGPRQNNDSFDLHDTSSGTIGTWYDTAGQLHHRGHQEWTEVSADPTTPATGDWALYFKSGGLYVRDDAGAVTGPLGTGGSGGGWPFTGKVLTVDTADSDADYSTLAAAIAAATSGDTILLSAESHACVNLTLPDNVHLFGHGIDNTVLTNSTNQFTLKVGDGSIVANLTIASTYASNQCYPCYMPTASDTAQFINVKVTSSSGGYNTYAFYLQGDSGLVNCEAYITTTAYGYAIQGAGNWHQIVGGRYDSDVASTAVASDDVNNPSGACKLVLVGPVLLQGTVDTLMTGAGTIGRYFDPAGHEHQLGAVEHTELSADPSTPATGDWRLYFKAGGLYIIDDAGSVTGPLGTGGGGAPVGAQYLVLTADATLTDERVMVAGDNLTGTDGGAGGNYTIDLDNPLDLPELGTDPTTPAAGQWKIYFKADGLYIIDDTGTVTGPFIDTETGAPETAQYVTLATDATLTNERVLVGGDNITLTDGGAGGNITADLDDVLIQTEQGADPSTPSTGDWGLYFKAGGLYVIDDAGAVTGPLSAGGTDTYYYPPPDKCMIGSTEYATFAAAVAAASSGDVIVVGEGIHACNNLTLASGVNVLGVAPNLASLSCSSNALGLTCAGNNTVENISINQIVTESTSVAKAVNVTGSGCWFYNCYMYSFNSGTQNNYGFYVASTGGTPNVNWCHITATNGSSGDSYAVYIDQSSGRFRNCGIDGSDYGVYCNTASSSPQFSMCSIDTTVTAANTISWSGGSAPVGVLITTPGGGWGDGTLIFPSKGSLHMAEWSTDPATPETSSWELYFKSGGLYHKDDAGAVVGPLSAGGGYPFNVITVDATDTDADYSSLSSAITASSVGDWFEIGKGQLNPGQAFKADQGVIGKGWGDILDKTNYVGYYDAGTTVYGALGGAGTSFNMLNFYAEHATDLPCGLGLNGGTAFNCFAWGHGTGTQDVIALHVTGGTCVVNGGYYKATTTSGLAAGIKVDAGATLYLTGLPIVECESGWEFYGTSGSVYGAFMDIGGRIWYVDGNVSYMRMPGWEHYTYSSETISSGAITPNSTWCRLYGQGSAADELDTITETYGSSSIGQVLYLSGNNGYPITIKHGTGNIWCPNATDVVLNDYYSTAILLKVGTIGSATWHLVSAPGIGGGGGDEFFNWGW